MKRRKGIERVDGSVFCGKKRKMKAFVDEFRFCK